MNGIVK